MSITIKLAPRVLPLVIAIYLSQNTQAVTSNGTVIEQLSTVRALNNVSILYISGANALADNIVGLSQTRDVDKLGSSCILRTT